MARRQLSIKGTERPEHPDIIEAAEALEDVVVEWRAIKKRVKQKSAELELVLRAHKVKSYKFFDDEGDEVEAYIDEPEPRAKVRRTGEAEAEIGEGIPESSGDDVHPGLIAQAMKAQSDAHVEVDDAGDVVVPDKAEPKKSRKKKAK